MAAGECGSDSEFQSMFSRPAESCDADELCGWHGGNYPAADAIQIPGVTAFIPIEK